MNLLGVSVGQFRKPGRASLDLAFTLHSGSGKTGGYIDALMLTARFFFFFFFSFSSPLMLINLSNGVAGSCCLGFLIKIASYTPLTARQGPVFGPRCRVILKKPGNPI